MIKAAKRIFNSDKICRSYSDLNFGVTFLEHVYTLFRIKCSEQRNIANEKKHTKYNVNRHAVNNTNLHRISHHNIGQIIAFNKGVPLVNAIVFGNLCEYYH